MTKLAMIVKTKTQPGKRDAVRALWDEHLKPRLLENKDQQLYLFCDDNEDDDAFFLVEVYTSQEAFGQNAAQPFFAAYMEKVGPLLAGRPEVSLGTPSFAKGFEL